MPKSVEDIIPPERKRSIRNVPLPRRSQVSATKDVFVPAVHKSHKATGALAREKAYKEILDGKPRKGWGKAFWTSVIGAVIILLFAILSLFNGGTLAYTPKSVVLTFANDTYTAHKTGTAGLLYSVVKLSGDKGAEAQATGEQDVSRKASGTIIIYNTSSSAQKLRETTRFETDDGKIYQIPAAITLPAGKPSAPSSVEVTVYAEKAGADYNIELADFTLPGLKGTNLYSSIYARSKTPMSGGFVGKEKTVSEDNLKAAKSGLQNQLKDSLLNEARAQVPEDFVLIPSLSTISFEDLPQTAGTDGNATINQRGNLYAIMFKRSDLASYLASKKTTIGANDNVDIEELENLTFNFAGDPPTDLLKSNEINFTVSGSANAVWLVDEAALKKDLIGKPKSDVPNILNNYPSVLSATTIIRPFWKSVFPSDITHIQVKRQSINAK